MNKLATAVALVLALTGIPATAQTTATVVSTGDGDTLRVKSQGKVVTIRMACIDAPETGQRPWGQQSAAKLKQLLPPGKAVQVREIERDRYGRTVAELYLANQSVNLQMVKQGQAVVYRQYLTGCASTKNQYLQSEAQAKQKKLGFWNQPKPVMPWDFRKGQSASNQPSYSPKPKPAPSAQQNCSPAYPGVCIPPGPPDLNCPDISYRNFKVLPPDPHGFDRDSDGVGCEKR
ncbi:thermonuclease family protein [Trichocoleus sp. Lan]|uniref:thermonuclease family protein n=1 Tax=Trichocoleus sp. Lan TaxID=2933927 RepID=UPI00329820BC